MENKNDRMSTLGSAVGEAITSRPGATPTAVVPDGEHPPSYQQIILITKDLLCSLLPIAGFQKEKCLRCFCSNHNYKYFPAMGLQLLVEVDYCFCRYAVMVNIFVSP